MAFDRQLDLGFVHDMARVTCDRNTDFAGTDKTAIGLDADDRTLLKTEVFDLAILDDVDPQLIGRSGVSPGHRVMPDGATPALQQSTFDREASIIKIQKGIHVPNLSVV